MIISGTLATRASEVEQIRTIRKADLKLGDCLVIETRNSLYRLVCLGQGLFRVSGGWFNRKGLAPMTTTINGCTWGGSAIHAELAAGHGLFLEFGNKVLTTRIRGFTLIPAPECGTIH
jgi:hypothetical protein